MQENVSGSKEFTIPDTREEVRVYVDSDVTISYFDPKLNNWGPEIDIVAPGDFIAVINGNARITGTARVIVC